MFCEPFLHLLDGVRIFQSGKLPHLCGEFLPGTLIDGNGLFHQHHVKLYAPVVDLLVEIVFLPQEIRHGELRQLLLDRHLGFHVTLVIRDEGGPPYRVMLREIACPAAVGLGRLTGDTEIADERLALSHLLVFQLQNFADPLQREGQPHVRAPYQGAAPGGRVKVIPDGIFLDAVGRKMLRIVPAQPDGKADPLEGRIIRPLDNGIIRESFDNLLRYRIAGCQVVYSSFTAVCGHAEKQNLKIRRRSVFIHAAFLHIDTGEGLQIDG